MGVGSGSRRAGRPSVTWENLKLECQRALPGTLQQVIDDLVEQPIWENMHDFDAWGLVMLLHHMQELRESATKMTDLGSRDEQVPKDVIDTRVFPIVIQAQHHAKQAHLQSTHNRVWDNGPFNMASKIGMSWHQLQDELLVLRQSIEADLEQHTFLLVPPKKAELLAGKDEVWGPIWKVMQDAKFDTDQAINCLAFGFDTAAVFHFMRVAEHGLRRLAKKVRVTLTHKGRKQPVEYADWEKVIDAIKNKIGAARQGLGPGSKRQTQLAKWSDAADHCTYMKDIWRNSVSHTRGAYKPSESASVTERVRDFMCFVAESVS